MERNKKAVEAIKMVPLGQCQQLSDISIYEDFNVFSYIGIFLFLFLGS